MWVYVKWTQAAHAPPVLLPRQCLCALSVRCRLRSQPITRSRHARTAPRCNRRRLAARVTPGIQQLAVAKSRHAFPTPTPIARQFRVWD